MNHVTRIYHPNLWSETATVSVESLTLADLLDENLDFESFAQTVWDECEKHGWYNDSDMPDVLCIYVKGAMHVED